MTYVVEDNESGKVLAYFSLANDKVSLSDFESKTEFNRFRKHRFVNEKRLKSYPAGKLCRLAVDNAVRSLHLGSYLVKFIKSYFVADNKTGCRFLTVDAYADAIPFYLKNGFIPLNEDDVSIIPPALCEQPQEAGGFLFPVCQRIEKYTGTSSPCCRLKRYSVLYRTTTAPRQSANSCKHDLPLRLACAFFDRQENKREERRRIFR